MKEKSVYSFLLYLSICLFCAYFFLAITTIINIAFQEQGTISKFQNFYGYVHVLVLFFLVFSIVVFSIKTSFQRKDSKTICNIFFYWMAALSFPIISILLCLINGFLSIEQTDFYSIIIFVMIPSLFFPCWITFNKTGKKAFIIMAFINFIILCFVAIFLDSSYTNAFSGILTFKNGILITLIYQIPLLIYAINYLLVYKFLYKKRR